MKFYTSMILLLLSITSNGQLLTGKITNIKQDPISDVYVYNLRSMSHTHTSVLGSFSIENTKAGDTLNISAIGLMNKNYIVQPTAYTSELLIILEDRIFELEELVIEPGLNASKVITTINLKTDPVNSSQEILQNVPGLFIGQHAGGGKAEQLFLRGFDIDHGTDVAISVDGMPVNMVSHAHGQGYADLHFVIPETIQYIDFDKGSYDVSKGNFATAGYVDFQTKERLEESSITTTLGAFNTTRNVGLIDILNHKKGQSAYMASEYLATDGPYESKQHFSRINLMGKYTVFLPNNNKITTSFSHFTSSWDASGQIPERAIASKAISRFGAIDDTEGGETSRTNLIFSYVKGVGNDKIITNSVYYTNYAFELYSNFTFFLNDPINGDQIRQKETRDILGINRTLVQELNMNTKITTGLGLRNDQIRDNELSRTANRKTTLERVQLGAINETNVYGFGNINYTKNKWQLMTGARIDFFKFNYNDLLAENYETNSESAFKISPKFSTIYNANSQLQLFLKGGLGFHSNDARLMAQQSEAILPTSYNADMGTLWKPASRFIINTNLWYLYLEDELIYVGDEGIVESGGTTQRLGVDFGIRYQARDWLFLNTDINYAHARSLENATGEDYVPLAPNLTMTAGIKLVDLQSFSGGIQTRFLNDRPANEDNSIIAEGYMVTDMNLTYQWKNINLGVAADNLFDTKWNETQFATTSRLKNEPNAVEEIHFTPGTPFQLKGTITYTF